MKIEVRVWFCAICLGNILKEWVVDCLQSDSVWIKKYDGLVPSGPPTGTSMSLQRCAFLCELEGTCRAFFYTTDTGRCHHRESMYHDLSDLISSQYSDYFEPENATVECPPDHDRYRTVFLALGTMTTFRLYIEPQLNFAQSYDRCVEDGGTLAHVTTETEKNFFRDIQGNCSEEELKSWIDLTNQNAADFNDIKQWTTMAGQAYATPFWEDLFNPTIRNCGVMLPHSGSWKSVFCDTLRSAICEK